MIWSQSGAETAWVYFGVFLPICVLLVAAAYLWRTEGLRQVFVWRREWAYVLAIIVLAEAVTYKWLFADSFYRLSVEERTWRLHYVYPQRTTRIDASDVERVTIEIVKANSGHLVIETRDGRRFRSGQAPLHEQRSYADRLEAARTRS